MTPTLERLVELPPYSFWIREGGSGTPVILLHGLGGSSEWWRRNFDALARDHRVFAVDLIGFGRNRFFLRPSRLPLALDQIAAVLARWIEQELGQPAHIIGNSMGGQIAIHLAASRPDVVRSLVLVNSTGVPFRVSPGEHLRNLFLPRGLWSFLVILARDIFRAGPSSLSLAFGSLLRDDARPLMRDVRAPVLLVWGEHDALVPLRYAKEMLVHIPNSRLEVIPRAAHVPMWDNPRAFNDAVVRFFNEVEPTPSGELPRIFSWPVAGWSGGIAYREAGRSRNVVLVHGLGMSSKYFAPLAAALFEEGWSPIAPDLPGFGESVDANPSGPEQHASLLAAWADVVGIEDAVWVGHSFGCNAIGYLAMQRPDIVSHAVYIGPLWRRGSPWWLFPGLLRDAIREPLSLYPLVFTSYWRAGFARFLGTFFRYAKDLQKDPAPGLFIVGARDPLVDRVLNGNYVTVGGAHACHFGSPKATARVITGPRSVSPPGA